MGSDLAALTETALRKEPTQIRAYLRKLLHKVLLDAQICERPAAVLATGWRVDYNRLVDFVRLRPPGRFVAFGPSRALLLLLGLLAAEGCRLALRCSLCLKKGGLGALLLLPQLRELGLKLRVLLSEVLDLVEERPEVNLNPARGFKAGRARTCSSAKITLNMYCFKPSG